jgi:hypothetical protein
LKYENLLSSGKVKDAQKISAIKKMILSVDQQINEFDSIIDPSPAQSLATPN